MAKPQEKQEVNIAVMANDIKYIKDSLVKIDARLEAIDGYYLHRDEFNEYKKERKTSVDDVIKEHTDSLRELDTFKAQVKTWGTVAIILVGILEFIINRFL